MTAPPMGADDLGVLLKHTPDWIRAEARAGRLPHHKVGKLYVFTPDDVAEILAATAVSTRPPDPPEPVTVRRRRYPTYHRVGSDGAQDSDSIQGRPR